jgi:hypothetical protein
MAWLLLPEWIEKWIDHEDTFCDKQKINSAQITMHLQRNVSPKLSEGFPLQQFMFLSPNTSVSGPANCKCGVAREPNMILKPPFKLSIFCKCLNLTELPSTLPAHTIALDVSSNRIAGKLDVLSSLHYKQIRKLNISYNTISSIEGLRYTSFLSKSSGKKYLTILYSSENEPVLDLTHNNLSTIPTWLYASQLHSKLYLFGNPWSCPCLQVLQFTSFHKKNTHLLPDGDFLACADMPGSIPG